MWAGRWGSSDGMLAAFQEAPSSRGVGGGLREGCFYLW